MNQAPRRGERQDTYWDPLATSADDADAASTSVPLRSYWLESRIVTLDPGSFDAAHLVAEPEDSFGILILDGLILARLELGRAHAGWLVGAEDLLRPWQLPEISLLASAQWQALKPSRVLRIDRGFRQRLQHDPHFVQELLARSARTSHWLFAKTLVTSSPSIEDRLVLLFALWSERWGKVTPEGICIDLPLTHQMIAELCGARRPTVSVTLRALEKQGVITRRSRSGWVLGRAPTLNGHCPCWPEYTASLGPALRDSAVLEGVPSLRQRHGLEIPPRR